MSRLPFFLLGLLATALSAAILLQFDPAGSDPAGLPQPAPRGTAPVAAPVPGSGPAPGQAAGWVAATLARPLFSPDRRPPPIDGAARPADAPLPRLTGTLVTTAGRSAIFAGAEAPVVVGEGGRIGTFTVHLIESGRVTLLGPDGQRTLRPSFDPTPRGARSPTTVSGALPLPPVPSEPPRGSPSAGTSVGGGGAAEGTVPFEQNTAPSGLDILRNAARNPPAAVPTLPLTAAPPGLPR